MFSKYTSKASKLLRDHTFSKAYLLIVLSLAGIYLTATAVVYQGNLIASYIVFFLVAVFIFTNTKKFLLLDIQDLKVPGYPVGLRN